MRSNLETPAAAPSHPSLQRVALDLVRGAFLELYLSPKPGLVDLYDCGSHPDLSVARMEMSLRIVSCYLHDLCDALYAGESLAAQVRLGTAAERAMLRRIGTNCHRGYIFLSGLLLAASAQVADDDEAALSGSIAGLAERLFARGEHGQSNGSQARARFQAGGIKAEALAGLPSLFEQALPAYRGEIAVSRNRGSAVFAMLGRRMENVEDTTALHRCGTEGLRTLRRDGEKLQRLVADREDYLAWLAARNEHYVRENLTMGGVADLLALGFALLSHSGELTGKSGSGWK